MSMIGPNAKIRVEGIEGHNLGTLAWKPSREKTPRGAIGRGKTLGYNVGFEKGTWNIETTPNNDGTMAYDWEAAAESDSIVVNIVAVLDTRTVRLIGVVDEAEVTISAEDGTVKVTASGKYHHRSAS